MQPFHGPSHGRVMCRSSLAMATLLTAGLLVPAPGDAAVVVIAATGLILLGAQRATARRLTA